MNDAPVWGLGFSPAAQPLLQRLLQSGLIDAVACSGEELPAAEMLAKQWNQAGGFVIVAAAGLVTRLLAPLLRDKAVDPPVVVLDPQGRFAIPVLGGHARGAEQLSQRLAAALGGTAVLTGSSSSSGQLALDAFGHGWGWTRGCGDWNRLMQQAANHRDRPLQVQQSAGLDCWQSLAAAAASPIAMVMTADGVAADAEADLLISSHSGLGCRWHPPQLWLGLGCERNSSLSLLERLVMQTLATHGLAAEAVAGIASIDRKGDEAALLALSQARGWPLRLFTAAQLNAVVVPNPSSTVAREMGTASVAEAAALLAAGPEAALRVTKTVLKAAGQNLPQEQGAATLAVAAASQQWAPHRGELHLVGSGPGALNLLTGDAREALSRCSAWVGYGLYLDLLEPLRRPDQLRFDGQLTRERERCQQALQLACQGVRVALISSGDSGIYGMAGLALERWLALNAGERPRFAVHPGISALQLAAARCGAPLMHDFCTISLSDRLTPWPVIEQRLIAAAQGDFVVALYNPRSQGRDWQLRRAQELLLQGRPGSTPVALARQLGRPEEEISLHTLSDLPVEAVDMLTLVLVGNSSTRAEGGKLVTPRGYPGAELA